MKKLLVLLLISLVVVAGSCTVPAEEAAAGQEEAIHVDASYDGKEVQIAPDQLLVVTLECDPPKGLKWDLIQITSEAGEVIPLEESNISVQEHVTVVEHLPSSENGPPPAIESPGKEVWTLAPLGEGKSTIYMEYRRAWEKELPPQKTFTLTIVVK